MLLVAVDQDVGDGGVLQQRFQRPVAQHLVHDFGENLLPLQHVERELELLLAQDFFDDLADLDRQCLAVQLVDQAQIDQVEQPVVDARLHIEVLIGHVLHDVTCDRYCIHVVRKHGSPLSVLLSAGLPKLDRHARQFRTWQIFFWL